MGATQKQATLGELRPRSSTGLPLYADFGTLAIFGYIGFANKFIPSITQHDEVVRALTCLNGLRGTRSHVRVVWRKKNLSGTMTSLTVVTPLRAYPLPLPIHQF